MTRVFDGDRSLFLLLVAWVTTAKENFKCCVHYIGAICSLGPIVIAASGIHASTIDYLRVKTDAGCKGLT